MQEMLGGNNLIQVILYGHLLLEQALDIRIAQKLKQPEALDEARLSFAQKANLYIGLYDPDKDVAAQLRAFNVLRNRIAHRFVDVGETVLQTLILGKRQSTGAPNPLQVCKLVVGILLVFEFNAIKGALEPLLKQFAMGGETIH